MNRPYTAQSPYALTPTERIRSPRGRSRHDRYGADRDTDVHPRHDDELDYEDYEADYDADYPDDVDYLDEARVDRRWMWIAGVAGAVLFVAVIMASMILGGGDSGSVSATIASDTASDTSSAPSTSSAPEPSSAPRAAAPVPQPSLPAETVTTISPTPTAQLPVPAPAAPLLPAPQAAPPPASTAPGTVTYRITGTKGLLDLVTVIYTDSQGALQTDVNVALPWSKTITLDPGVTLSSVTGTSLTGQLNCEVLDANGAVIAAQNGNSIITNCTR
ncbi:hypothetical protein FK535_16950 [Mycolicibacterium sp. 018/SC-01/001]|uniref:hypothetical protein n=1 Tax=Mycolicibacterium sp. 018/SC-01/001 TaxID=2592069 RepID=UPI00118026AE|nr:hypothetical protein [Mycolicibacterium sp. 018/SC-01/001]TRW81155.1 hypothetical protein FK535_16950 [Mycolicibacterium sp. 018/SC-01/001]